MSCRTGCATRDHASYSECLRAAGTKVAYANSANNRDYSTQKRWDSELDLYRRARSEGIQPETTKRRDIEAAMRASDETGMAYQA